MKRFSLAAIGSLATLLVTNGPGLGSDFPQPSGVDGVCDTLRGREAEYRQHVIARPRVLIDTLDVGCSLSVAAGAVSVTLVNRGGTIAQGTFVGAVVDGDWTILDLYLSEALESGDSRTLALGNLDPALFAGRA